MKVLGVDLILIYDELQCIGNYSICLVYRKPQTSALRDFVMGTTVYQIISLKKNDQ